VHPDDHVGRRAGDRVVDGADVKIDDRIGLLSG
jgi:hypothetical protein